MNEPQISSDHLKAVATNMLEGRLIPFFGAGVNLCGHSQTEWKPEQGSRLPSGSELSKHLATKFSYPLEDTRELARVSQYADTIYGRGRLYEELHALFDQTFEPTPLHRFFARLPELCAKASYPKSSDPTRQHFLIVTTNYDDVMEKAFVDAGQKFHVITYVSELHKNASVPVFLHWPPSGGPIVIDVPNKYDGLDLDTYPIILKVHGAVDRISKPADPEYDSFVITEDHYIDYLSRGDVTQAMPMRMKTQLIKSSFLFLGYALRDWNLRAFLLRIWREQRTKNYKSWAVSQRYSEFEKEYLPQNNISIIEADLDSYIRQLEDCFNTVLVGQGK